MIFIGDVHGKWDKYFSLLETIKDKSIQLGDFGMGFHPTPLPWNKKHVFIRGNHDNPDICRKHSNYLGEYGITEDGIFYVGGAFSIDKQYRLNYQAVTGKQVWWANEQIDKKYHAEILYLYDKEKPKIVATHDCPACIRKQLSDVKDQFKNDTSDILFEKMFKIHKPKLWIFGHYHKSAKIILDKITFICLNELERFEYEV